MATDGEQNSLENMVDEMLEMITNLAAKVTDPSTQTAALKPLLPLAKQLDGLLDKVTKLQAAAFEGFNQIAALDIVVSRLERAQLGDKEAALELTRMVMHRRRAAAVPQNTSTMPLGTQRRQRRTDPRFHPRARNEFPTFDGKEDPLPWLNHCETSFRC
jgi:hypothetical protein